MGCRASDHALEYVMYVPASEEEIEVIVAKKLAGGMVTKEEELKYKTAFMIFVGREYSRLGWVMQLHYGCKRDNNTPMFERLGPDTGYDCINNYAPSGQMAQPLPRISVLNTLSGTSVMRMTRPEIGA